ncbi:TITAN-like protein isoform X2 [Dioscorea cayenensis subsp. rotundata]|uniref:TITAN-like protein isoform X2 n=1 Tax=Dioscorea cayennensis subsp. rotundata TaxID=55577 RepID=A0AB40BWK0_DIOCR|nr:TITAN-like protein isoform X2 [Dioscorea cayenensis subsp. rotundata]
MAPEPEKPPAKKKTAQRKGIGGDPFEFCDVCNLNHDHGRRHKYLPSHLRALSSLFSRFHSKLSDLRFFLKNPVPLRPEHSALNRIWCVFCRLDIQELYSLFACENAIEHMAGEEHLKNLKNFLWKYGGGMDRVDSFRVSESDLSKWKKECELSKCVAPLSASKHPIGPVPGPSKDIQFEHESGHTDSFDNNSLISFNSSTSLNVMPLQSHTYQEYWKCFPEGSEATTAHAAPMFASSPSLGVLGSVSLPSTRLQGVSMNDSGNQVPYISINRNDLAAHSLPSGEDQRKFSRDNSNNVTQKLTRIPLCSNGNLENVHTGGAPPWLLSSEENDVNLASKRCLLDNIGSSTAAQNGRSKKLNPKRVGAAWAEKRRLELELEKQGKITQKPHDANWLPNFGRVWQAGTRKESRKEFEKEKRELSEKDQQSDTSFIVQPYLSKRMRTGSSNAGADADAGC